MSDEKNLESAEAGSSKDVDPNAANMVGKGQSTTQDNSDDTAAKGGNVDEGKDEKIVSETQYKELEKKLGSQGQELGDLRNFYDEISPLMDKLQGKPELIDAILKDKISPELIGSVVEGKVSEKDAKDVTKAYKDVKKELGKEGYENTSPEDIKKLIEEKVNEVKSEFEKTLHEKDDEKDYEDKIKDFISNTPDFQDHAGEVAKYVQEHPGLLDIQAAYDAVKGKSLQAKYKEQETKDTAEAAKNIAANAGGGAGQNTANLDKEEVLDKLIGKSKDPNGIF